MIVMLLTVGLVVLGLVACVVIWMIWDDRCFEDRELRRKFMLCSQDLNDVQLKNLFLRRELEMSKKKEWYCNLVEINRRCCQIEGGQVQVDAQEGASYLAALGQLLRSLPSASASVSCVYPNWG